MKQHYPQDIEVIFNLFNKAKVNICLLIDTDGIILKISPLFTENFGYETRDVLGKHFSILFTEGDRQLSKPQRELTTVFNNGWAADNFYLNCKDGSWIWVSGECLLVESAEGNYIIKIFQNIQSHKFTQHEAIMLKDFNENILSSIDDCILVLDRDRNIVKYNESFKTICNSNARLTFDSFLNLIPFPEKRNELEKKIQEVIDTRITFKNYELELSIKSDEEAVLELSGQPLMDKVAGETILMTMHDISSLMKLEKEREDILGFVAHELRNPLTNLILCNKLIEVSLEDDDRASAMETLERSKKNIVRLNNMVIELYKATQAHGGQIALEESEFEADEMVEEAVEIIEHGRRSLHIQIANKAHVKLTGDKFKLIQVLTNYLTNAIKYSGIDSEILIRLKSENSSLVVSVQDHGLGISKDQQPYVFNRFFRTEKTRSLEGIGLGLYLCRRIINAHHGRVWVESEDDKGSTFYFSVPLRNTGI